MLRLDPTNEKDAKFLKDRGLFDKYYKDILKKSMVTIESPNKKPSSGHSNERALKPNKNKRSKYNNTIIEVNGVKWRSKYEYACYEALVHLEKLGKIRNLKTQVKMKFEYNGVVLWKTIPDFYFEVPISKTSYLPIYADAKNSFTNNSRTFKTGQKMFQAFLNTTMLVFLQDKKTDISLAIEEFVANSPKENIVSIKNTKK